MIANFFRRRSMPSTSYRVHLEELMRFRRLLLVNLHVWPALPATAHAKIILPNKSVLPIPIEHSGDHSVLYLETTVPAAGLPVEKSRLRVTISGRRLDLGSLGQAMPQDKWRTFCEAFFESARQFTDIDVLEIGSRTRDDTRFVARKSVFGHPSVRYCGIDIVSGPDVDVVGDIHKLSQCFPDRRFDIVFSNFVFEHLMMPWLAVIEINKVLKPGGRVFINTNHSAGLHDWPWDFFRYSESAWRGLFNEFTGFEIIDAAMGDSVRITPMRYSEDFSEDEGTLGYKASGVLARKIGESKVSWDVDSEKLLASLFRPYPKEIKDRAQ